MRMLTRLSVTAACALLLLPGISHAQIPPADWQFILEDGQGGSTLPGGLTVNLDDLLNGGSPFATIPTGATLDLYALIFNNDTTGEFDLALVGANLGTAGSPAEFDLSTGLFQLEGGGFPSWLGPLVDSGQSTEVKVGTLDVSGFLNGLPQDGALHDGNASLSVTGVFQDANGTQGDATDVIHDPLITVWGARQNPTPVGPTVPEPGSLAMLGALVLGGGGLLLRRKA